MANKALLTDIALRLVRSDALSIYRARTHSRRDVLNSRSLKTRDFALTAGRENLAQAISIRLLTPRGELAALAHPDFGSRLPELIGEQRTETNRNLAKLYILEALKQEPRVAEVVSVEVTDNPGHRHRIDIFIQVRPIDDSEVVDVGPFSLDLG